MLKCREKLQKIITSILLVITCTFAVPNFSQADFGGKLFRPVVDFFAAIGDVVIGGLQYWMLGTSRLWSATMEYDNINVTRMSQQIEAGTTGSLTQVKIAGKTLERGWVDWDGKYDDIAVPNIIYSPELIFSNMVPALDINFLNPNPDRFVLVDSNGSIPMSTGTALHDIVSAWYMAFRNIALVGLLSVLVYIGIRIVISSSAGEKSQYKERLTDWLVALCLLFVLQYIMSFTINITEQITKVFAGSQSIDVIVSDVKMLNSDDGSSVDSGSTSGNYTYTAADGTTVGFDFGFTTNLMGYLRFLVYSEDLLEKCAYLIIYLVLVVYTVMFTFIYLKRVLYMAFFTMIAPLVALTYPLDKLSDGKAQAFNLWLREYIFNALIQPMHLALYTMLMTSAMHLATSNPIYALVAVGFLFPAEKFLKKMFGFDKAQTPGGAGSFVGGALTMSLFNRMRSNSNKKGGDGSSDSGNYIDKGVNATKFALGSGGVPGGLGGSGGSGGSNGGVSGFFTGNTGGGSGGSGGSGGGSRRAGNSGSSTGSRGGTQVNNNLNLQNATGNVRNATGTRRIAGTALNNGLTGGQRALLRLKYMTHAGGRKVRNAAKSAGKFTLNTGVKGIKGLSLAAIAAIPALTSAVASGGDFSTAGKVLATGFGVGATLGPSGEEMLNSTKKSIGNVAAAGRTADEQKTIEARKKFDKMKEDPKQLEDLRKTLRKSNVVDQNGKADRNKTPEKWISENEDLIKEYLKKGASNIDTIYKVNDVAQRKGLSADYAHELAKVRDTAGKRINDPEYMQNLRNDLMDQGLSYSDAVGVLQNLRDVENY